MAGVDISSGIAALQRGAGMGAEVATQHGNAMSRGYAGIGQALAGVGQAYKAWQAKSKEEAALGSVADAAEIAPDDPVRGDPQTLVMAIKRKWDTADQTTRQKMQDAKLAAEASMKGQDRDHDIGMFQRQQDAALGLERERNTLDIERDAAKSAAENARRQEIGSFAMGPEQVDTAKPNPYQFFGGVDPSTGTPGTRAVPDRAGRPPTPEEAYRRALSKGMDPNEARSMAQGFSDLAPPKPSRDPVADALAKERALKAEGLGGYGKPTEEKPWKPLSREDQLAFSKDEAAATRGPGKPPDPSAQMRNRLAEILLKLPPLEAKELEALLSDPSVEQLPAAKARRDALIQKAQAATGGAGGPTPEDLAKAEAMGLRWDAAAGGFVPK